MTAAPIEAYERWAYGVGWTAGLAEGHRLGFDEGYPAGFGAGADVGGARMLLALEAALGGRLPDLLPDLPHAAGYQDYRDEPLRLTSRAGHDAAGALSVYGPRRWPTARPGYGQRDFPGGAGEPASAGGADRTDGGGEVHVCPRRLRGQADGLAGRHT